VCEQTLSFDLSWFLFVDIEQTLIVLTTPTLQKLPPHVIDLDELAPLAFRFHAPAFDKAFDVSITSQVPLSDAENKNPQAERFRLHAINHDYGVCNTKDSRGVDCKRLLSELQQVCGLLI
jgi:hypothetical protein